MQPTFCFLNDSKMYVLILEDSSKYAFTKTEITICQPLCWGHHSLPSKQLLGKHWIMSTLLVLLVQPSNAICIYAETSPSELFPWSFLYSCGALLSLCFFCLYLGLNWTCNCWFYRLLAWRVLALPFHSKTPASLEREVCCGNVAW